MRLRYLGCLFLLAWGAVACSGIVAPEQVTTDEPSALTLAAGKTLGQTFVARQAGLAGVEVFLYPGAAGEGQIVFHLRPEAQSAEDLASDSFPLASISAPGYYRFTFSLQPNSRQRYYYAEWSVSGAGSARFSRAEGGAYLDGALYQDTAPEDAQMAFRLVYDPQASLLGWARVGLEWLGWLIVGGLLFVLPGWAVLRLLWPVANRASGAEQWTLSIGVSLALYPLLLLWTDLLGLRLGAIYAWGPAVFGLATLVWHWRDWRGFREKAGHPESEVSDFGRNQAIPRSAFFFPNVALLVIIGLIFFARFWTARNLEGPMWGDSVQHTVIAQLLLDHGGLFNSWQPYTPYASLTNQFGFSALAAVFAWLTGHDGFRATLIVGQLVNGLAAMALYPLAVRLARKTGQVANIANWAGVGAVLVAGLLSPLPGYYVNWGRFAQLAGQAILPGALWLLWEAVEHRSWRTVALAGLVLCGLTLAYYRMPFYYVTFILAWLIGWAGPRWKLNGRAWFNGAVTFMVVGGVSLVLFAPWAPRLWGSNIASAVEGGVTGGSPLEKILGDYQSWAEVTMYVPLYLLMASGVAVLSSLFRRQWMIAATGLWVAGLSLIVAGRLVHLPGANMIQNYAVILSLYIQVSLVCGWLLAQLVGLAERFGKQIGGAGVGLAFGALSLWGMAAQFKIAEPVVFNMVMRPDVRAMEWIRANTPTEAVFLVEGFSIYNRHSAVGADAGWWIPLLAGRANTMPPQYALFNERPFQPDYSRRVTELVVQLEDNPLPAPAGLRAVCEWGVTHVYVGQRQGWVGGGARQLFAPPQLSASPAFTLVYHQDRVYIFALDRAQCASQ